MGFQLVQNSHHGFEASHAGGDGCGSLLKNCQQPMIISHHGFMVAGGRSLI